MYKNKTFCFSPPIMIATFLLEFFGAIYTIIRYKMDRVGFITVLILTCLSVFQIAEYMICEVINLPGLTWARIGYVAITLLPPLGISLMMAIANKKSLMTQLILYLTASSFIIYFLFIAHALTDQVCSGNYVIFTASEDISKIYGLYYYGLLAITVFFSFQWTHHVKSVGRQKALKALAFGSMAFIIPTTTVNLINPTTIEAIPSIMCGFAVLLALTLIIWVLPNAGVLRKPSVS